ncbi:YcjF family protein [uncultured Ruminobacter sp.]|uniref:YcjF family protein n=1 Tax=uncultured Ruminobacter sp. TaxID=538947 RepID=UPI0025D1C3F6|nr:YcjF family protein [uncultured Ruminobacter sp.]
MSSDIEKEMKQGFELGTGGELRDVFSSDELNGKSLKENGGQSPTGDMIKGFTLNASAGELTEVETDGDAMSGSTTIAETDEDDNHVTPVRFWSSPVLWIMLLLLCYGGLQTYAVIDSAFTTGSVTGIFWSAVFIAAFVMSLFCIYREFSSVLLFKQVDEHREEVLHACASGSFDDAVKICRALAADSKVLGGKSWENFSKRLQPHFTPADVFQLYEHQVLRDMDERAKKVIVKRSRENGVIVALSPVAWLDMFLTLARSLRMIREISEIYGLRAGVWGRMQLYRRVARNLILIGMTDLATDAAVDVIGAGIAGKLSASLGQGVAAGIYSTRLGYMTVKAVRPLGISPKVITLAELRRDLLSKGKISELIKSDAGK